MKNLVMRCAILVVCAIPLVLAAGAGTAGADDEPFLHVKVEVTVEPLPTQTIETPEYQCLVGYDACVVVLAPAVCIQGVGSTTFGLRGCTAIGTD